MRIYAVPHSNGRVRYLNLDLLLYADFFPAKPLDEEDGETKGDVKPASMILKFAVPMYEFTDGQGTSGLCDIRVDGADAEALNKYLSEYRPGRIKLHDL